MKWLAAFFCVLILFLMGQPACSVPNQPEAADACCAGNRITDCSDTETPTDNNLPEKPCKGCNPFQVCSCCVAGVLASPEVIAAVKPTSGFFFFKIQHRFFAQALPRAEGSGIWQPPRLA